MKNYLIKKKQRCGFFRDILMNGALSLLFLLLTLFIKL